MVKTQLHLFSFSQPEVRFEAETMIIAVSSQKGWEGYIQSTLSHFYSTTLSRNEIQHDASGGRHNNVHQLVKRESMTLCHSGVICEKTEHKPPLPSPNSLHVVKARINAYRGLLKDT